MMGAHRGPYRPSGPGLKDYALERSFKSAPDRFEEEAKKLAEDANIIRKLLRSTESGEVSELRAEDRAS
jgi:hypothetical protein